MGRRAEGGGWLVDRWRSWLDAGEQLMLLPREVDAFDDSNALVIAPHMDDEVIGCGATMLRHVIEGGSTVAAVFVTDGGGPSARPHRDALVARRKDEARAVAEFIGAADPIFLDEPDTELVCTRAVVDRLRTALESHEPSVVYVPWVLDAHRDHVATTEIVAEALRHREAGDGLIVRAYETWAPVVADVSVDISAYVNRKLAALQFYESQFVAADPGQAIALNRHRAMSAPHGTHTEAFAEWAAPEYVEIVSALRR